MLLGCKFAGVGSGAAEPEEGDGNWS